MYKHTVIDKEDGPFNIVNCTPHTLDIRRSDGFWEHVPPCGIVLRAEEQRGVYKTFGNIDFATVVYGEVDVSELALDPNKDILIVSSIAADALRQHPPAENLVDMLIFTPGPAIRDSNGLTVGCDGLTFRLCAQASPLAELLAALAQR